MTAKCANNFHSKEYSLDERRKLLAQAKIIISERKLLTPKNFAGMEEKFLSGEISLSEFDDIINKLN